MIHYLFFLDINKYYKIRIVCLFMKPHSHFLISHLVINYTKIRYNKQYEIVLNRLRLGVESNYISLKCLQ